MKRPDRRKEFKDVPWQQGRLLLTDNTRLWSFEQRDEADDMERCMAFAYFTSADNGISREYVFRYNSHEECIEAIELHNKQLEDRGRQCP